MRIGREAHMRAEIIQNPLVRQNLEVICEAVKDLELGPDRNVDIEFFCDLETGMIFYTPAQIPPHEMAQLTVTLDIDHRQMKWKTRESEKLLPKATAHLQEMADVFKKIFPNIEKLSQLANYHWQGPLQNKDHDSALKATWHDIDREGAERLLLDQPAGTYLFRQDHYVRTLQDILRRGLKKTVKCFTLTYLDNDGSVKDRTVVFFNQKWTFYDDDPSLSGPTWPSLKELLKAMGSHMKYPLLSENVIQS